MYLYIFVESKHIDLIFNEFISFAFILISAYLHADINVLSLVLFLPGLKCDYLEPFF